MEQLVLDVSTIAVRDTSRKARGKGKASFELAHSQRRAVLGWIVGRGPLGATDEEIQVGLGLQGNTERPRRGECVRKGWVVASEQRRRTGSGALAIVWVATDFGRAVIGV